MAFSGHVPQGPRGRALFRGLPAVVGGDLASGSTEPTLVRLGVTQAEAVAQELKALEISELGVVGQSQEEQVDFYRLHQQGVEVCNYTGEYQLENASFFAAQLIRKVLLNHVPCMAFSQLRIVTAPAEAHHGNMYETLLCKLGQIPLAFRPIELKGFTKHEAPRFSEHFKLHKSCPLGDESVLVKSGDLEWVPHPQGQSSLFPPEQRRPVRNDMVLTRLYSGQTLSLELVATLGVGKQHVRYAQGAALVAVRPARLEDEGPGVVLKVETVGVYHPTDLVIYAWNRATELAAQDARLWRERFSNMEETWKQDEVYRERVIL